MPKTVFESDSSKIAQAMCCNSIRERAYQKWEEAGQPASDGVEFWLIAEQELSKELPSELELASGCCQENQTVQLKESA